MLNCLFAILDSLGTFQSTGTSGGNKTDLHTRRSESGHGRWVTNMLMVTTTVRMLYRVHSHTSNLWPAVTLDLVLVVGGTGLEHRLLGSTSSGNLSDHGATAARDELLGSAWELNSSEAGIRVLGDDDSVGSGSSGDGASVSGVPLDVGDDGTFWHGPDVQDVPDGEGGLLSGVDELSGVETLHGAHELLLVLVPDRVPEGHLGEWRTATRVVNDFCHDSLDVAISLAIVESPELGGSLSRPVDGLEDTSVTLTLSTNHATHLVCFCCPFASLRIVHTKKKRR